MSVSIAGSPASRTSGSSYAPEAGSNRAVLIINCAKITTDGTASCNSITWGSTTKTTGQLVLNAGGVDNRCGIAMALFTGSEIATGNVSSSWNIAVGNEQFYCITLTGSTGVPAVNASNSASGTNTVSCATIVGNPTIGAGTFRTVTEVTTTGADWTEVFDELLNAADGRGTLATNATDATSETYDATNSGDNTIAIVSFTETASVSPKRMLLLGVG